MLDIEGYDFEILKMLYLPTLQAEVVIFEESHFSEEVKVPCCAYLETFGYLHRAMGENRLAILSSCEQAFSAYKKL